MDQRHDIHPRLLIDPLQFEQAGRAVRLWLERLLGHKEKEADTSIAWEDGESDNGSAAPPAP